MEFEKHNKNTNLTLNALTPNINNEKLFTDKNINFSIIF